MKHPASKKVSSECAAQVPPNKHMQRAGTHKVLGRGRPDRLLSQVLLARVLIRRRAVADGNR
jgi:hypothetical protein